MGIVTPEEIDEWEHSRLPEIAKVAPDKDKALEIYRRTFYLNSGICDLPEIIRPVLFDMAISMGIRAAIEMLQVVLGKIGFSVEVDGNLGYCTRRAASYAYKRYGNRLIEHITNERIEYFITMASIHPKDKTFLAGRIERAKKFNIE